MGKQTLFDRLREWVGGVGFRVFLWSIRATQDEYIEMILEDARREYQSEKNNSWFVK
jgi:nitrogen fixation-related uncharacterized protein